MSDLGKLTHYLGIEVAQEDGYIKLKQTSYARQLLEKAGLGGCNPVKYPIEFKLQINKDEQGEAVDPT